MTTRPPAAEKLGRYELYEEIGRGMTHVVYRAFDPLGGRQVAVKVVDVPHGVQEGERLAFEQRVLYHARLAERLSHPGLVIAQEAGKDPESGRLFVVFEYLEGETLAARLAAGATFDWRGAFRLVGSIAEALNHAHSCDVVHRDVRPDNIFVLRNGEPRIMDVGVARLETARMTVTSIQQAFGVPLYMSPEQAVGETVDARSDIFSLGTLLYRLLTREDPFAARDPREILARVVHFHPPRPSAAVPELPAGTDAIVAHALAKSPSDRYDNAKQLGEDVEDVLAERWPRHSADREWSSGTERFQLALSSAPAAAPAPEQQANVVSDVTVFGRRRFWTRLLVGVAALLAVGTFELVRRGRDTAMPVAESGAARATALPAAPIAAQPAQAPVIDSALPSLKTSPTSATPLRPTRSRFHFELRHAVRSGRVVVMVDDRKVLEERLAAGTRRSLIGTRTREGRVRRAIELPPGTHRVRVQVFWDGGRRSQTAVGTFKAGRTKRLAARLTRSSKRLSLEWR